VVASSGGGCGGVVGGSTALRVCASSSLYLSLHPRSTIIVGWHYKSTNDTKMRFNNGQLK